LRYGVCIFVRPLCQTSINQQTLYVELIFFCLFCNIGVDTRKSQRRLVEESLHFNTDSFTNLHHIKYKLKTNVGLLSSGGSASQGRLCGLAVECWTTDHYHPCSNPGVGISEGCFVFRFVSLPLEVAQPI